MIPDFDDIEIPSIGAPTILFTNNIIPNQDFPKTIGYGKCNGFEFNYELILDGTNSIETSNFDAT